MLVGRPGSGKTFFVRQLAKKLDFRFLPFNITQMLSRADILDCFDTLVTTQAQDPETPILVFVDEINAPLDGDCVYHAFLAPIEDGVYVRGGKVFHIKPCVWVFSGTEDPAVDARDEQGRNRSRKGSDFLSRLTLGLKELNQSDTNDRMKAEFVYRGVALILSEFPDVGMVSEGVLRLLTHLKPEASIRDMKKLVQSFVNVQYGKVLTNNIPDGSLRKLGDAFDYSAWMRSRKRDGDQVRIVSI